MAKKKNTPTTIRVPEITGGGSRFDSLNAGIRALNESLAGGVTGFTGTNTVAGGGIGGSNRDLRNTEPVFFTSDGAVTRAGKKVTSGGTTGGSTTTETGNTTGVTPNKKNTEVSEPGVISSVGGESTLKQYQSDAAKLDIGLGTPESPLTDTQILDLEKQGIREGDTVPGKGRLHPGGYWVNDIPEPKDTGAQPTATYIDPNTGATTTTTGVGAGSEEEKKKMSEKGYSLSESTTPAESTDTPEIKKLKEELTNQEKEIDSYKSKLIDLIITDADLKSDIRGITKAYDARINEMRDINNRQIQSVKTLGFRMGMQFTGAMGGVWGGIISDAERQGLLKIADIEGEKQSKILEAKAAARENNYKIYASLMDDARELQKQKTSALADLVKAQKEQDQKIAERKAQVSRDAAISNLYAQGITDPAQMVDFMNYDESGNLIGDTTLEEVEKALKILNPPDALKGLDADYQTFNYLKKINDPSVAGLDWIDYQRVMANLKATASGANKTTAEERAMNTIGLFANAFVPGATTMVPDKRDPTKMTEIYVLGPDNYANPTAFNEALSEAQQKGLPRETFLREFGYLVNPAQSSLAETIDGTELPYEQYALSPEEFRAATGVEPQNIGVLTRTGAELTRTSKMGTGEIK